ncbi:uncharacterized protein LOC131658746 [Vicia villosa]|uniref:uncharacterized protein LOC131658746 n=1 Tax=Vicia villosa TaxID=3911 RepID=UPI00273CDFCC|nr:uncharacterized protein LOC131658746 [Vicia villosa]
MDKGKGGRHRETSDTDDHSHRNKADDASGVKNNGVNDKKLPPAPPMPSVQNAGAVSFPGAGGNGQKQPFSGVGAGSTSFFLSNLHWWTTDADVEYELCKYGEVRDLSFFLYDDCGKSKGYCKVEFYDPLAAAACKKGLNGHRFNGRPCVVSSSWTPFLGTNQPDVDKKGMKEPNQVEATKPGDENGGRGGIKEGGDGNNPGKKGPDEVKATKPGVGNGGRGGAKEGGDGDNRGYGRGNWGRGNNLGRGSRGHGNLMRNRGGGMGGRSIMMGGSMGRMGGAAPRMLMHPRMGPMSRMGGDACFPGGPIPQSSGNLPSYRGVGLRGVAPYGNYSFCGRGMPMRGKGMIPRSGMGGPNMGRLGGDEHGGGKAAEASNGEEAASDHQNDEVDRDRGDSPKAMREKDRGSERDFPVTSERTFKDDRVPVFDRYVPSENDSEHDHEEIGNVDDREISRARSRDSDIDCEQSRSRDHVPDRERGWNRDLPNAMREKDRGSERDLSGTSERIFKDDRVPEFDRYVPSENDSDHDHPEIGNLDDREISRARSRDSDIDRERSRSRDHVRDHERGWNRDRQRQDRDGYADHPRLTDHAPQHNDERERGQSTKPSIKSRLSYPTRKYSHNGKRR